MDLAEIYVGNLVCMLSETWETWGTEERESCAGNVAQLTPLSSSREFERTYLLYIFICGVFSLFLSEV